MAHADIGRLGQYTPRACEPPHAEELRAPASESAPEPAPLEPQVELQEGATYAVRFESFKEVEDHIEFCMLIRHISGLEWRVWRRFSMYERLHQDLFLAANGEALPPLPPKGFLPSFTQPFDGDFCEVRRRDLSQYIDALLVHPTFSTHASVQSLLGVAPPETPKGVRMVPRCGDHELEIRPVTDAEGAAVDGYKIELVHVDTGASHGLTHHVGNTGLQVQKARIGRLAQGEHRITVSAFNLAGESASITVPVFVEATPTRPQSANTWLGPRAAPRPQELLRNEAPQGSAPRSETPQQQNVDQVLQNEMAWPRPAQSPLPAALALNGVRSGAMRRQAGSASREGASNVDEQLAGSDALRASTGAAPTIAQAASTTAVVPPSFPVPAAASHAPSSNTSASATAAAPTAAPAAALASVSAAAAAAAPVVAGTPLGAASFPAPAAPSHLSNSRFHGAPFSGVPFGGARFGGTPSSGAPLRGDHFNGSALPLNALPASRVSAAGATVAPVTNTSPPSASSQSPALGSRPVGIRIQGSTASSTASTAGPVSSALVNARLVPGHFPDSIRSAALPSLATPSAQATSAILAAPSSLAASAMPAASTAGSAAHEVRRGQDSFPSPPARPRPAAAQPKLNQQWPAGPRALPFPAPAGHTAPASRMAPGPSGGQAGALITQHSSSAAAVYSQGTCPEPSQEACAASLGGQAKATESEEESCVVCLASAKTHAFVPCGHKCVCAQCGFRVLSQDGPSCPICRVEVSQIMQIFG